MFLLDATTPTNRTTSFKGKAEQYLNSERDIVSVPGSDSKAMMVASKSSNAPHLVRSTADGQYSCDHGCLPWKSSKICAHTVAVAEKNGELLTFLQWYIRTNQEPNITSLAMSGLPSGRGRKGGVPKRKRSVADGKRQPEVVVHRRATQSSAAQQHGESVHSLQGTTPQDGGQGFNKLQFGTIIISLRGGTP